MVKILKTWLSASAASTTLRNIAIDNAAAGLIYKLQTLHLTLVSSSCK
jgi:hypothetical protein